MLKQALLAILTADHPQTVRQVFYQMVSRGFVDKTEQEYDGTVCRLLGEMREDGRVPWDWVIDNTRWVRRPVTYDGLSHAIYSLARGYRRDLWKNADHYVEIWVEKDALAGVLEAETEPLDVPLLAAKGYSSLSFLHAAALNIADLDKPAYIYHLGDSDPSGENAALVIERDLRKYAPSAEIHFKRLAVLDEQIIRWNLPLRDNKPGDPRTAKFHRQGSVELDAIPARELRKLVRDAIMLHVNEAFHAALKDSEAEDKAALMRLPMFVREGCDMPDWPY